MKNNAIKRMLSLILATLMIVSIAPVSVFSDDIEAAELYSAEKEETAAAEDNSTLPPEIAPADEPADEGESAEPGTEEAEKAEENTAEAPDEPEEAENNDEEEPEEEQIPFEQSVQIDDVIITVTAEAGAFPENATLYAAKVPVWTEEAEAIDEAVEQARGEDKEVKESYTFDIKILLDEVETEPAEGKSVNVKFSLAKAKEEDVQIDVYHIVETAAEDNSTAAEAIVEATAEPVLEAVQLSTEINTDVPEYGIETEVTVTTDGFSYYVVEFTYNGKTYVMEGGTVAVLRDILNYLEIYGESITDVQVSNEELITAAQDEDGEWYLISLQPFETEEWMKVSIDGKKYEIRLTDAISKNNYSIVYGSNTDAAPATFGNGTNTAVTVTFMANPENPSCKQKKYIATGRNGITIAPNSTVVFYVAAGFTLYAKGADGSGRTPGRAAIYLPSSSKLFVIGKGKLECQGGKAGTGSNGGYGGSGEVVSQWLHGGTGGSGGSGGGGAGAGIGTDGGTGGSGGSGGVFCTSLTQGNQEKYENGKYYVYSFIDRGKTKGTLQHSSDRNGSRGSNGSSGGDSDAAGKVYFLCNGIYGITTAVISGGAANDTHGGFGSSYTTYTKTSKYGNDYGYGGGGGGGGGQGGRSAYDIGQGGQGGAGGGGGGSGGTFLGNTSNDYCPVGGYGGGFTGSTSGYYGISAYGATGGTGGRAGTASSNRSGTQSGKSEYKNIDPYSTSGETEVKETTQYTIRLISNGNVAGTLTAYYGFGYPETVPIPANTTGYKNRAFLGYYTEKDGGGTQIYDSDGKATDNFYALSDLRLKNGSLELYAFWDKVVAGVGYKYFKTAQAAIDYCLNTAGAGTTIKLYDNVAIYNNANAGERDTTLVFNKNRGQNVTFDLNGCSIRAYKDYATGKPLVEFSNGIQLQIISSDGTGTIENNGTGNRTAVLNNGGELVLNDGNVRISGQSTKNGSGFGIENRAGSITVHSGTIIGTESYGTTAAALCVSGGEALLYGGNLTGGGDHTTSASCVYATGGSTKILGGTYEGIVHGIYVNGSGAKVTIGADAAIGGAKIEITGKGEQKRQAESQAVFYHGYGVYVKNGECTINGESIIKGYSAGVCSEIPSGIRINYAYVKPSTEKDDTGKVKPCIEGDAGTTVVYGGYYGSNVQFWCAPNKYCYHVSEVGLDVKNGCEFVVSDNSKTLKINGCSEPYSGAGIKGYTVSGDSTGYLFTCHYYGLDLVKNESYNSDNAPVNCGNYKVDITYYKDSTHGFENGVEFSILPADLKISPNPGMKKNYGEADPALGFTTNSLKTAADETAFNSFKSGNKVLMRQAGEDAGFYPYYVNPNANTFIVPGDRASNYKTIIIDEASSEQFEIVGLNLVIDKWPENITATYNGETMELLDPEGVVNKKFSDFASFYYSTDGGKSFSTNVPSANNAGTYTISYYVHSNNRNYKSIYKDNITGNYFTLTSEIRKADPVYTPPVGLQLTYNGKSQELIKQKIKPSAGCKMEYSLSLDETQAVWTPDPFFPSAKEVGEYMVYYRVKGNRNYNDVPENETHFVEAKINAVPVPPLDLKASDITYGDNLSLSVISNVPEGWTAHWENGTQLLPAGIHSCNALVEGPDNRSYETKTVAVNVTVHPRETLIYWNWDSERNYYIYDGQVHCPEAVIANLVAGDECLIEYSGQAAEKGEHEAFVETISNRNYCLPEKGSLNYPSRFCRFKITDWSYVYGKDTYGIYDGITGYHIEMYGVPAQANEKYSWAEVSKTNLSEAEIKAIPSWTDNTTNPKFIGGPDRTHFYCVKYDIRFDNRTFNGVNYVTVYDNGTLPVIVTMPEPNNRIFDGNENRTIKTEATATYNGQPCSVEYAVISIDNLSELLNPNWQSYDDLDTKREAGYYFTLVRAAAEGRYSSPQYVESCIAQRELKVQWKKDAQSEPETVDEFTYQHDGESHVPVPSGAIVDESRLSFIVSPESSVDVGKYTATVTIDGRDKDNYILICSPQKYKIEGSSRVITEPVTRDPVYNEQMQALVDPGEAENGTMLYSLDNKTWSLNVPEKKDSGHYDVYYMVRGNEGYSDYYAEKPVPVRFWPNIVHKIYEAAAGDSIYAEYDEQLSESVTVNKNLTIDMQGHTVASAENATLIVEENVTLELVNTYLEEGGFINSAAGKAAAMVKGTLNINNSYTALKGSTAVKCESGGTVLISNGRYSGALHSEDGGNLKVKGGFFSKAVQEQYLFKQTITDKTDISKEALCFANGREDSKDEYPFRVSTCKVAASNLMIGAGTTVRFYIYLDGDEEDVWSFEVRRENSGSGQPWIEHPELSEERVDIFNNGKVLLPYIEFSGVNPQCMSNYVETFIYLNGEQAFTANDFSVKSYDENLYSIYGSDAQLDELLANMLEYGGAAQIYKDYNRGNMANDSTLAGNETDYAKPTEYMSQYSRIEKVSGYEQYRFKNVGMLFGDQIKMYFTFPQSIDSKDLVIEIDGKDVSKYSDYNKYVTSGEYAGFTEDISLTEISRVIEVVMYYKGVETDRMTFSPGLYVQAYADSLSNTALRPVVKRYYEFAKSGIKYEES